MLNINESYYLNAYNELLKLMDTKERSSQRNKRIIELSNICYEGQQLGIKELQKVQG